MSVTADLDPMLRYACKLLHSPHADAAEKIRNALDDLIRQRHGAHRTLAQTLPKRHLADEHLAPGSGIPPPTALPPPSSTATSRRPSSKSIDSRASSLAKDSPVHITTITLDSGGSGNEASGSSGGSGGRSGAGGSNVRTSDDGEMVISVPDDDDEDDDYMMSEEDHMKVSFVLGCFIFRDFDLY